MKSKNVGNEYKMQKISLDTNILIDSPEIVFTPNKSFVVSFKVIQELDNLKRNPNLKYAAQSALRNLWAQIQEDQIEVLNLPDSIGDSPDEIIINDTKEADAALMTDDIGARLIAKAFGVPLAHIEAESALDPDYTGIVTVAGDVDYEKDYVAIKELPLDEFQNTFNVELLDNTYCIIDRVIDKNDIWWNNAGKVERISQSMKPLRDAGIVDAPLDSEQMCAIHAVMNNDVPLTVIDGKVGSGKTITTLIAALACTIGQKRFRYYDTILVTKPPVSIDKALYTGFKPGTSEEKMSGHLGGIVSNLKFLLEKSEKDKKAETGTEVWNDYFDVIEIDEIQGVSLHNTILIVDEYQLLSNDVLKLVLTRIASGSKVVLVGDTRGQTYGVNRANEGFKRLYEFIGTSPLMSYIRLENIYRSALADFVNKVYND